MKIIDKISLKFGSTRPVIIHVLIGAVAFAIIGGLLGLGPGLFVRSIKLKQVKILGGEKLLQKSIPSLINKGENEFVEFKPSLRYGYRQVKTDKNLEEVILRTIAGFLN